MSDDKKNVKIDNDERRLIIAAPVFAHSLTQYWLKNNLNFGAFPNINGIDQIEIEFNFRNFNDLLEEEKSHKKS